MESASDHTRNLGGGKASANVLPKVFSTSQYFGGGVATKLKRGQIKKIGSVCGKRVCMYVY